MTHLLYYIIASLNCALCGSALIHSLKEKQLIALFWIFSTYISIMFFFTGISGRHQTLGFTGEIWSISYHDMNKAMMFVLVSNALFLLGAKLPNIRLKPNFEEYGNKLVTKLTTYSYFIVFIISFYIYYSKVQNIGYQGFVEYSGSDWSRVFLVVSSLVVMLSFLKKYYSMLFVCIILISILSYTIDIRSFLIIAIIPLIVYLWAIKTKHELSRKNIKYIFLFIAVLAVVSIAISYSKIGRIALPESALTNYYLLIHDRITYGSPTTGFNSLSGFAEGIMSPFFKLASVSIFEAQKDTPTYMASLIFGTTDFGGNTFHYPSLWYSDSFVSFGLAGCLLGVCWGWLITFFDRVMRSNKDTLLFFMPYFVWFVIFVFRGAIANSTIAISYAFYIQLLIFAFLKMSQGIFYRPRI